MVTTETLLDENFELVGEGTLDSKKRIALTKAIEAFAILCFEARLRKDILALLDLLCLGVLLLTRLVSWSILSCDIGPPQKTPSSISTSLLLVSSTR